MAETVRVGNPIPRIAAVEAGNALTVAVTWENGRRDIIDLAPLILTKTWFKALRRDRALFGRVEVEEYGTGIRWNDTLDMAGYTLERLAQVQQVMSPEEFNDWKDRHHLTLDALPAVLGISRRQAAAYASGEKPIDRAVKLACRGYDAIMHSAAE
jgi:hypothetical protein